MEKVFIIAILITCLFCFAKFIEMKFVDKEMKPLKVYVRDAIIVLMCSIASTFLYFNLDSNVTEFFNVVTDNKVVTPMNTQIFTDEPGFWAVLCMR